ncbi:MAG: P-loop NTPase [Candidatus Bathyarchaeota archaeon]|nr:MAG: P-loop NTPase [Candidatus Bathyarchaeota archaeon]
MSDPRPGIIGQRLEKIGKIIAVSSGKGGVGKSVVASALALGLRDRGHRVGLLDLDFTSPASHVILGVEGLYPEEEYGIISPLAHGLRYMSITYYSLDKPTPLRGSDVSDAIIEILAITRWEELDYLIIDMPPGIGDATLDMIRLVEGIQFLLVTTPSKVAYETVRKQIGLLRRLEITIIGVLENMVMKPSNYVREQLAMNKVCHLGEVGFDPGLEDALGNVVKFTETDFYSNVDGIIARL